MGTKMDRVESWWQRSRCPSTEYTKAQMIQMMDLNNCYRFVPNSEKHLHFIGWDTSIKARKHGGKG